MRRLLLVAISAGLASGLLFDQGMRQAQAIKPFQMGFYGKYLKEGSNDPKDKAFVELVHSAKCFVCHEGKSKKTRNPYGRQLADLLDKNTDKDNKQKIQEAMDQVAKSHTDAKDARSPTFGDLIAARKLPGGGEPKGE